MRMKIKVHTLVKPLYRTERMRRAHLPNSHVSTPTGQSQGWYKMQLELTYFLLQFQDSSHSSPIFSKMSPQLNPFFGRFFILWDKTSALGDFYVRGDLMYSIASGFAGTLQEGSFEKAIPPFPRSISQPNCTGFSVSQRRKVYNTRTWSPSCLANNRSI
jgi:hypothetical protein